MESNFQYRYALLRDPGHNRVFYRESLEPGLAELRLAIGCLSVSCGNAQTTEIAGISYLSFESAKELKDKDLVRLSRLSFAFAMFRVQDAAQDADKTVLEALPCLRPLPKSSPGYMNPKISSILKYSGKTNEIFTRMMIHVALLASGHEPGPEIRILDPVAGKGTTLFEAMVHGMQAWGIEQDKSAVHDASVFLKQYLETERIKHRREQKQVAGAGKREAIYSQEFEYAFSKEEFKKPDSRHKAGFVQGDARDAHLYFCKNFFQLIVGDLPYGIAHGSKSGEQKNLSRNPLKLLQSCLPSWKAVLQKGGVIVLAWNTHLLSAEQLGDVFSDHGFEVLQEDPYNSFVHQVDRSIRRNILVARKAE